MIRPRTQEGGWAGDQTPQGGGICRGGLWRAHAPTATLRPRRAPPLRHGLAARVGCSDARSILPPDPPGPPSLGITPPKIWAHAPVSCPGLSTPLVAAASAWIWPLRHVSSVKNRSETQDHPGEAGGDASFGKAGWWLENISFFCPPKALQHSTRWRGCILIYKSLPSFLRVAMACLEPRASPPPAPTGLLPSSPSFPLGPNRSLEHLCQPGYASQRDVRFTREMFGPTCPTDVFITVFYRLDGGSARDVLALCNP